MCVDLGARLGFPAQHHAFCPGHFGLGVAPEGKQYEKCAWINLIYDGYVAVFFAQCLDDGFMHIVSAVDAGYDF